MVSSPGGGASSCWELRSSKDGPEEPVMLEPVHLEVLGQSSERWQDDKGNTFQTPCPSSPQERGEAVLFRLALALQADTEGRWLRVPATHTHTREERGRVERLFSTANWRPVGAPGRRLIRQVTAEQSEVGLVLLLLLGLFHPHPPQKHLRNPSQPVTGRYSSSRTLPTCPHSSSLLSQIKSEVSIDKGASALPYPIAPVGAYVRTYSHVYTHTHTHPRPRLTMAQPLPSLPSSE